MASTPALSTATDEDLLVQRLIARDEQALRILHDRCARNLLHVIARPVRDESLAQDILQEDSRSGLASTATTRGRLFTWMVRVCCNKAIDALRSPRHRFHRDTRSLEVSGAQRAQPLARSTPSTLACAS